MISDPADAKSIILSLLGDGTSSSQLGVAQLEGEPDYWLVTILAENGESLVSGSAYVVNAEGDVFETAGSLPPGAQVEKAKAYFH